MVSVMDLDTRNSLCEMLSQSGCCSRPTNPGVDAKTLLSAGLLRLNWSGWGVLADRED